MALERELQLARAPVRKFRQASTLILELKFTKEARTLLASGANRMPVLLETTVTPKGERDVEACFPRC